MTALGHKFMPYGGMAKMRSLSRILRRLLRLDVIALDRVIEEQLERNRSALEEKRRRWAEKSGRPEVSGPLG